MTYDRGAIVWSDDPFKDDTDAGRPWLILNTDAQPFRDNQSMAVALSTSGYDQALLIDSDDWVAGGVPYESYALPWAVHSPQHQYIDQQLGQLTTEFVDRVVTALDSYITLP